MASREELLAAALAYAAYGWKVFPVLVGKKTPATEHGVLDATTDPDTIRAWWAAVPYLIGMACGPESGVFVVDVDPRNGGAWDCPVETLRARTGGRYGVEAGTHYFFKWPAGIAKTRPTLSKGVDVQGVGKYVILPPSETDAPYEWLTGVAPADAPGGLLSEVALVDSATTGERPGDRFNSEHDWLDILGPLGWTVDHTAPDGEVFLTRPGKDSGVSASVNYAGSDLFHIFTTSTEFEPEKSYDKFGAYALLYHEGDISAAAAALAGASPRLNVGSGLTRPVAGAEPSALGTDASSPTARLSSSGLGSGRRSDYQFVPAVHADHIIDQFCRLMWSVTDAPLEYSEAAGLVMLSMMTSGMRVSLAHVPGGLRTNLFVCLLGTSSVSRKSTVQGYTNAMLAQLRPNATLPDKMTTESAINELGQRAVALWAPDEMGLALQQVYRSGSYSAGLEELLLTLYSGQAYRYVTVTGGERIIDGIDLSVLGASTPESIGAVSSRAIGTGLLPRFGVVYPTTMPPERDPVAETPEHIQARDFIVSRLRTVYEMCSYPGGPRTVHIQPAALTVLGGLGQELGKWAMTTRLVMAAYKVAALIALGDLRLEITAEDATSAVTIIRRWADGARHLRKFLGHSTADEAVMAQVDSARDELRTLTAGLERGPDGRIAIEQRLVARELRVPYSTLRRIRDTMEATGEVVVATSATGDEWRLAL